MNERPILFSGPMIRAILANTKTQTRRIFKPDRMTWDANGRYTTYAMRGGELSTTGSGPFKPSSWLHYCPYGQPGEDRLYARETWAAPHAYDHLPPRLIPQDARIHYAATEDRGGLLWRPSIHMPRWASRITLEITRVRVERLQDMEGQAPYPGDSDALAEGVNRIDHGRGDYHFSAFRAEPHPKNWNDPADAFRELWESINGPGSWDANPWVWVIEFRRLP